MNYDVINIESYHFNYPAPTKRQTGKSQMVFFLFKNQAKKKKEKWKLNGSIKEKGSWLQKNWFWIVLKIE